MMSGKRKSAIAILRWLTAFCLLAFSASLMIARPSSGNYKITVRCGRLSKNADRAFRGSTLYLRKHSFSTRGETTLIDSAAIHGKKAVFYGSLYALDPDTPQNEAFTAGQYDVCDSEGPLFSFFYSSAEGHSFSISFRHRLSTVRPYYIWETDDTNSFFGKENIAYLDYQNYLTFKNLSISKDGSEALAAEYAINVLYPGGDKVVLKRLLLQAEKDAPGSLTCTLLEMALNGFSPEKSKHQQLIADDRLVYTSFARGEIDLFLDKFKLSDESIRNMAIDYLMENRYLISPKMRAEVALECFRRYSSSIVMGCEGSAVYAAEKYILGNDALSADDRAEAAYYVTLNKGTLIGKKAPLLKLKDTSGTFRSTTELMGSYSIIYFYSDDCIHCKTETPKFISFLDNYKDSPLNVLTVYTGTDRETWVKYVKDHFSTINPFVNWIHTADLERDTDFPVSYGVVSTPKMFLLDESLRIKGRGILTGTLSDILLQESKSQEKSYQFLSQIFPVSQTDEGKIVLEAETISRKNAVDKIYNGTADSREQFNRLFRQTFTFLYFSDYAPNNEVAAYLGHKYILDMPEKWEDTVFVESVRSYLKAYEMNRPGSKAENLTLFDISENPAELLPDDGKIKVLIFYRPNCGICEEKMPAVKEAWKKYRKKATFTGVLASGQVNQWRKFAAENNLEFRQLYDKDHIAELDKYYYTEAVPLILIIDSANRVIVKDHAPELLPQQLSRIVDNNTKK